MIFEEFLRPFDNSSVVNAEDAVTLSLLQARLMGLPYRLREGEWAGRQQWACDAGDGAASSAVLDLAQGGAIPVSASCGMTEAPVDSVLKCLECGRPLTYVRTIWRAFVPHIDVWACEPCQKVFRYPSVETKH